ncbi:glycine oxidase ThiO [Rhizobium cauense]|uniref:glycine oxidase ThiO n=1 Tax=Rhizobium cauense TaxID=1166683 RepID=UPI001C6E2D79|nr:glycine oxidase ThiO [Rhizobium cauense]MBW9114303.1 glycine oxidase ThiO [Rhizobium cauense]
MHVLVKGAGVAGLTVAHELSLRGADVTVLDTGDRQAASLLAGGMLAPWCERESADEAVLLRGRDAIDQWNMMLPGEVSRNGTLVVAPARDQGELDRFAGRTSGYEWLDEEQVAALEPSLAGRFRRALFFSLEGHLNPRRVLGLLQEKLASRRVAFVDQVTETTDYDDVVDCTGAARIGQTNGLRGIRGEMLYLETREVVLSRPVRLLHPRFAIYIVPRGDGLFMVGATMIETEFDGPVSARSLMELLNAAYAVHPAFADAAVVETGAGVRPAFADNFPRVSREADAVVLNGLYRHGFLLAPAMAEEAADLVFARTEPGGHSQ